MSKRAPRFLESGLEEKIFTVRRLLSGAIGGEAVEYLAPPDGDGAGGRHLFRAGQPPDEHRLWLGQQIVDGCTVHELLAWLRGNAVPRLFATNTAKDVVCTTRWARPQLAHVMRVV